MKANSLASNWKDTYLRYLAADMIPRWWQRAILIIIVLGCLFIRLWTISAPSLDRTAWKELDYLMIAGNYWQHGFNFFQPEVSWPAEPPYVTEMEFPLVPFSAAILFEVFGYNVYSARLVTLFAFLLLIVFVFRLAKRELGPLIGLMAAFGAAVIPLYHPFGRYLFTEPLMIAMSVVSLFFVAQYVDFKRRSDWIWGCLSISLTIALKIEALYLLLPLAWIAFRRYRFQWREYKGLIGLGLVAMILPVAWYAYAYYLENVGAHIFGIFRGHNKSQTLTMLTSRHWLQTMANRLMFQISGGILNVLLILLGVVTAVWLRKAGLFFAYLLAIFIYIALIAEGHLDAPYRQLTIVPPLSVFAAMGVLAVVVTVISVLSKISSSQIWRRPSIIFTGCALLILLASFTRVGRIRRAADFPAHPYRWEVAQELQKYTDPDSKIVVAGEYSIHEGGVDLSPVLYQYSGLKGWTLQPEDWTLEDVEALAQKGATHFVALNTFTSSEYSAFLSAPEFLEEIRENYEVVYEDSDKLLLIVDLRSGT